MTLPIKVARVVGSMVIDAPNAVGENSIDSKMTLATAQGWVPHGPMVQDHKGASGGTLWWYQRMVRYARPKIVEHTSMLSDRTDAINNLLEDGWEMVEINDKRVHLVKYEYVVDMDGPEKRGA